MGGRFLKKSSEWWIKNRWNTKRTLKRNWTKPMDHPKQCKIKMAGNIREQWTPGRKLRPSANKPWTRRETKKTSGEIVDLSVPDLVSWLTRFHTACWFNRSVAPWCHEPTASTHIGVSWTRIWWEGYLGWCFAQPLPGKMQARVAKHCWIAQTSATSRFVSWKGSRFFNFSGFRLGSFPKFVLFRFMFRKNEPPVPSRFAKRWSAQNGSLF